MKNFHLFYGKFVTICNKKTFFSYTVLWKIHSVKNQNGYFMRNVDRMWILLFMVFSGEFL